MLLGIDLGTSRSSIVSMTGVRKTVETYVGYARDPVSRKMLKADMIYGRHALDNRLAVDLFRPLEKGVLKGTRDDATSAATRRTKIAQRRQGPAALHGRHGPPRPRRSALRRHRRPQPATGKNKQAILDIAKEVLDSVMIVSEPFTVAYGMERMSDVLVIDIGAGTTDLCRMHGTVPTEEDEVSYPIAGDAVDTQALWS